MQDMVTPRQVLSRCPIMPVVCITDVEQAVPLAQALLAGGISVIEITLRTPAALESIRRVAREVPGMLVGAGTVIQPDQLTQVQAAGAVFALSPGVTLPLLTAARHIGLPFIPGVATASDILQALTLGFDALKFFPAQAMGGVATLQAFAGPFAECVFCPTGGIRPDTARDFLALDNVVCVGGSWLAPAKLLQARDWAAISLLAQTSLQALDGLSA